MKLVDELNQREFDGLYRVRRTIDSYQGPLVVIDDEELMSDLRKAISLKNLSQFVESFTEKQTKGDISPL